MKQFKLQGFSNYLIFDNGTAKNLTTGAMIQPNAKGNVKIVASEDAEGIVAGTAYTYKMEDLVKAGEGQWADVPAEAEAPAAEKTADEIRKEKIAELRKAKNAAASSVLQAANATEREAAAQAYASAVTALDTFLGENKAAKVVSPELTAALETHAGVISELEDAKAYVASLKEDSIAAVEAVKALGGKVAGSGGSKGENPNKAPKLTYDIAQEIRKDYSVGRYGNAGTEMTVAAIAEKYGCSNSAVMFKVNYLQHKLKKGDTAYTPLVNSYYPAGAPFLEDKVKETAAKYKIPATA